MICKLSITLVAVSALSIHSFGQAKSTAVPACTSNCTTSTQKVAPTVSTSTATNSNSNASSANDSAVSTQSGNTINPTISPTQQQSQGNQSASQNTTGTISGGNTSSQANGNNSAGGSSSGTNTSSNQSSASGTNKSSNTNSTGASTSNATTGNNTNAIKVAGGTLSSADSATGGAGGAGGSATGGKSSATGGTSSASGGRSSAGASNGNQTLNTGGNTTNDSGNTNIKETFIPSMQPQIPFTPIAGSSLIEIPMTCGPLQSVVHNEVTGVMAGLFRTKKFINGTTDDLAPYVGEYGLQERFHRVPLSDGRKGYILYGHQPVMIAAVLGIAGGRSIGGGGTTANQASGQLGLGGTSSIQQIVMKIVLRDCEYGTVVIPDPPPPTLSVVAPPSIFVPSATPETSVVPEIIGTPVLQKKPRHKRKPLPACTPVSK